jgi:hypothetical protein
MILVLTPFLEEEIGSPQTFISSPDYPALLHFHHQQLLSNSTRVKNKTRQSNN